MIAVQIAVYGLGVYLAILLFYYAFQDSFLFFPPKTPKGVVEHQAVSPFQLDRGGVVLRGWLVNPQKASKRLLVYFGGNGEDISMTIDEFLEVDSAVLLVNYRGYGQSDGKPGQNTLYGDGLAIVEEVRNRFAPNRLVLLGRSLGSAVATYVAANRQVDHLVLVTPFDSIRDIARRRYPWLPVSSLLKHPFDSAANAPEVHCPVLVIHGGRDEVVPESHTIRLMNSFPTVPASCRIDQAGHGNIEMFPEYWGALLPVLLEGEAPADR